MNQFSGKTVLILGLGHSGLAMARWCSRLGAAVSVVDTRAEPPQLAALHRDVPQAQFIAVEAQGFPVLLRPPDAIYSSPGLSPEAVTGLLCTMGFDGVQVGGELDLFVQALAALRETRGYTPQILAVTGTNGKTTVTSLTGQLVQRAGKTVVVAGNIGPTLLDSLSDQLDADALPEVWVLELSSFQLDRARQFEPTAATVLNVTQDHLDWHGSLGNYIAAKRRVFGDGAVMVLNRADEVVMGMWPVELKGRPAKSVGRDVLTFGADLPTRPGDFGMEATHGMSWLVRAMEADETHRRRKDQPEPVHLQRLMPADALRIRGRHNALNALAALALASSAGCSLAPMLFGLREYRGEPHRVESIGVVQGIEYFDDSKGTNVGATVAALNGLGADRKLVVILGGDGKGQDFAPLALPVSAYVRAAVLIGRDAPAIEQALAGTGVPLCKADTMDQAVDAAHRLAREGDAVLMSPACASLDMFRNYEHRAAVFRSEVERIAGNVGQASEAGA